MGQIIENPNVIDVICQHTRDSRIIPLKIRIKDSDGEYQTYMIQSYKNISGNNNYNTPSGINVSNHIWQFECKILVFNKEHIIKLFFNAIDNQWKIIN